MNLAQVAEVVVRRSPRVLPSLLGGHSQLGRRIEHILSVRKDANRSGRGPLLGAALGLFAMCALLVQSPALVAFQPRTETATIPTVSSQSAVPADGMGEATLTPAALHVSSRPQARPLRARAHRPHVSHAAPQLIAAADHTVDRRAREANASAQPVVLQPAALLLLWNDSRGGFSATLVFATPSCAGKPNAGQTGFFLLQI
jgi:hypothetical protein